MLKSGLAPVTFLTLLLTGAWMTYAGWFAGRGSDHSPRKTEARAHAQVRDPFNSEAAWRYRRCQPSHWRSLVMQR